MNQTISPQASTHQVAVSFARLSQPHGYRFDGDNVHLHARLTVLNRAAYQRTWALQLWACPVVPNSANDLAGQIIAEIALPPMSEVADEIEHMDMSTFACPPAGSGEHFMVLVLAAGVVGRFNEIHDIAVYSQRQQFLQPRMWGNVGYRIDGNHVHLSVEHIENPREITNCCGTLALELWALAELYAGGSFQGSHLAGVSIGSLFGQTESFRNSFELPFFSPPAGDWHYVLMLREWTAAGYITRDFTNFSELVRYSRVPEPTLPIVELPVVHMSEHKATVPTKVASVRDISILPVASMKKSSRRPAAAKKERVSPTTTKVAPAPSVALLVPVNTATEEQLSAVDGLSPQLAREIKKLRPFTSLDDLRHVKGMTVSIMGKIRPRIRL